MQTERHENIDERSDDNDNTDREPPDYVTVDQEVWVIDRLNTLVEAAEALHGVRRRGVGADNRAIRYGINGLLHGTAAELFNTLNLKCEGENVDLLAADEWLVYDREDADAD